MSFVKRKLLIIDDEQDLRDLLVDLLEETNLEISIASNGVEGIERICSEHFDAILSDERMPQKTGLEVLRWLRDRGLKTPFIIQTGYGRAEMMNEAEQLGAYAFIDKPWDEQRLINVVKEALHIGSQLRS